MAYIPRTKPLLGEHRQKYRPSSAARGYGHAHRQQRKEVIKEAGGVCEMCGLAWAEELDHKDRNVNNTSRDNLQALCKRCHIAKTIAERKEPG